MRNSFWLVLVAALPLVAENAPANHYDTLLQTHWFATSGGFAGSITPEGHAVAAILQQSNAVATFQRLLQEEGPAQQLYGLLGLHLLNAPEYKTALPLLLTSKTKVPVLVGCVAGEQEVGRVARQIRDGVWKLPAKSIPDGTQNGTPR
jgi:hypothetical protein